MKKLIKKTCFKRLLLILTMFSIYVLLLYLYRVNISPEYSDQGFVYNSLSIVGLAVSVSFFIIPVTILPVYPRQPSDYTVWALYLFSYAPTALVSVHILNRGIMDILTLHLMLLTSFILFFYSRFHNFTVLPKIKINLENIDVLLLSLLFIILIFYVWKVGGFKLNWGIGGIYERRLVVRETIVSRSIGAYILSFSRHCMLLIGIYLGIAKKKIYYFGMTVLLSIGIFSLDGTKTSILIPCVLGVLSWLLIVNPNRSILFFPIAVLLVCLVGLTELVFSHSSFVNAYLVRRICIVPGVLNSFYWDFFSVNPKGMLTDSFLKHFMESVYDVPLTFVIGREYLNNVQSNANTGIWMGWYANFGIAGVFAASVIGGCIVGLIDKLTKSGLYILGCMVCLSIGINWSEQMLHTSILTGGIFFFIIILLFINISSKLRNFFEYPGKEKTMISAYKNLLRKVFT
nr:hypothetical protein [uncultured Desulfobacter sp.]